MQSSWIASQPRSFGFAALPIKRTPHIHWTMLPKSLSLWTQCTPVLRQQQNPTNATHCDSTFTNTMGNATGKNRIAQRKSDHIYSGRPDSSPTAAPHPCAQQQTETKWRRWYVFKKVRQTKPQTTRASIKATIVTTIYSNCCHAMHMMHIERPSP